MVTENADFWSKIGIFGARNFLRELIIEEVHRKIVNQTHKGCTAVQPLFLS